jgi:hypothetical protein
MGLVLVQKTDALNMPVINVIGNTKIS